MKEPDMQKKTAKRMRCFLSPPVPLRPSWKTAASPTFCQKPLLLPRSHNKRHTVRASVELTTKLTQALLFNTPLYLGASQTNQKLLTAAGLRHALFLGLVLWTTVSWQGYVLCFAFLILGSLVTRVGKAKKEALGIAEARGGARGPENLWGAAGVAAILAIIAAILETSKINNTAVLVAYAGSLAAKFADTASSEIGKAYGTQTYLLTTLQPVPRGTEGGVSVEGTVAGVFGAMVAAALAVAVGLINVRGAAVVTVAGVAASTAESLLGASQIDMELSNEVVNFVNTAIGGIIALALWLAVG